MQGPIGQALAEGETMLNPAFLVIVIGAGAFLLIRAQFRSDHAQRKSETANAFELIVGGVGLLAYVFLLIWIGQTFGSGWAGGAFIATIAGLILWGRSREK